MASKYIDLLDSFNIDSLPNLDIVVLGALELFALSDLPTIDFKEYRHVLVVGSGNAEATGKVLFENTDTIFGSESTFEEELENITSIDGVVLISASGGKDAPRIAERSIELGRKVKLITETEDNPTKELLSQNENFTQYVLPKNREPYTYNTSTYMGMILSKTREDPVAIKQYIESVIDQITLPDFSQYQKYFLIVPPEFSGICRMLQVKFIELFGREIARDIETSEYMRHATTVVPSQNELFISFGEENTVWGEPQHRLFIPLPNGADYGAMMAIGYYIVGKIQAYYPHLFKHNIEAYTEQVSQLFGKPISPIVEK